MLKTAGRKGRVWKHSRRAAWRKVADEAIILDVESAAYFSLSAAGLRMWELLGEKKSPERIGALLAKEFDAPAERIEQDCAALVAKLRKEGLLEPA